MKLFSIITAALMASAGGAYYVHSTNTPQQPSNAECPVALAGGCCLGADKPQCCAAPCPACATDCRECCDVCEACCVAGAQVSAKAKVDDCCAAAAACCAGPDCCFPGAPCCEAGAPCCLSGSCCDAATRAVTAGATVK
jgi:hypothetical protein